MGLRQGLICLAVLSVTAPVALALPLAQCTRITHVSHGGQAGHRDMGEGRVAWLDWWSQEGSAHDIIIVECASGAALRARTAEENMSSRAPFHRTERAVEIIDDAHQGARVFATLEKIAAALDKTAKDIALITLPTETCACAALYPDLRGDKPAFALPQE